jgi:hypothetical protein
MIMRAKKAATPWPELTIKEAKATDMNRKLVVVLRSSAFTLPLWSLAMRNRVKAIAPRNIIR